MRPSVCKRGLKARGADAGRRAGAAALALLLLSPACAPRERLVRIEQLESAPQSVGEGWHVRLADPAAMLSNSEALGRRLALIRIRTAAEWDRLATQAPGVGPCPDLERGIVVGLVYFGGSPLGGVWPLEIESVRVSEGGGLVEARFNGGTFLADGTGFAHLAHVEGLRAVLVVDIDSVRLFPR